MNSGGNASVVEAGHVPVSLEAKVAWLAEPATYSEQPSRVECIQTHFAYVFLTDTRAYKLKKPLKVYGADLRALAERERCCREELRLNSRLAKATYLGVVPIVESTGRLALGGPGVIVDWLVEMRRLDRRQMLDTRLQAGAVRPADLEAVIARVRDLDSDALRGGQAGLGPHEYVNGIAGRLEEALREIARPEFGLSYHDRTPLAAAVWARYLEVTPLLADRVSRVREGHGDLRAEHVWLGPPVQIIDALEFDRVLRMLDPAEDVAMLAVDTERLAGRWTRDALFNSYVKMAGDRVPERLWQFYLSLRAVTRAKVALWHLDDPTQIADPSMWQARAQEYLSASARFLTDE